MAGGADDDEEKTNPDFRRAHENHSGLRGNFPVPDGRRQIRRSKRLSASNLAKLAKESISNEFPKFEPRKLSLFNHAIIREIYGLNDRPVQKVVAKHLSSTMPGLFSETELDLGDVNKVFTSQWVNDRQVVMGTKCNKIIIKDVYADKTIRIPSLDGSRTTEPAECPCGIHAISINPSRTLLATGAEHTNDLAVYRLPSFDPVLVGEHGHTDWIFDLEWVDDEYCITGSRDTNLAIWKVEDDEEMENPGSKYITGAGAIPSFDYKIIKPVEVKPVNYAEKIRALAYNAVGMEIGVLSLNSKIHTWDIATFQQKDSSKLPHYREAVCMAYDASRHVYAVGSQSYVSLLDKDLRPVFHIESLQKGFGIRSVSFNENIVTIGTGLGSVLFYDMNAGKYLQCNCGHPCQLKSGSGYLLRDNTWRDYFSEYSANNAIYTHCYDESRTRLFAAGGPLPAGLVGNYAGVWQ